MGGRLYNPLDLSGKLILVTGASSGIGRGTAHTLSRLGAQVILAGRREDALVETRFQMDNPQLHTVEPFDLNDIASIPDWVRTVVRRAGAPLSGFVHSAGVSAAVPLRAMTDGRMLSVLGPNLHAALSLLKATTARGVVAETGASLVLISSIAGLVGEAGLVAYSASKGALHSAVRSAARELAAKRIRVNCVAPGYVETPMLQEARNTLPEENYAAIVSRHPLGIGGVDDVANAVSYLLSDASKWVTGITLTVDGGYTA